MVITVKFSPLGSVSVVCWYFGAGRFLFINVNVAASTVCPHSIRTSLSVSKVKRALPTVTTADGFGRGMGRYQHCRSLAAQNTAERTEPPSRSLAPRANEPRLLTAMCICKLLLDLLLSSTSRQVLCISK